MKDLNDIKTQDLFDRPKRGGARLGGGRPSSGVETKVIRVPVSLLLMIESLKANSEQLISPKDDFLEIYKQFRDIYLTDLDGSVIQQGFNYQDPHSSPNFASLSRLQHFDMCLSAKLGIKSFRQK